MISLRPGTSINIPYLNRLQERAQRGNITVAGAGVTAQDSGGGMVFAQNPQAESWPDCQRMYYRGTYSGETLLPGSLVHVTGYGGWDITGSGDVTFDLPDYSGRRRLGILREGAASHDCPMVQYQGIAPLLYDLSTEPAAWIGCATSALAGRRLGARMHSPYAQWDANGPLIINGVGTSDGTLPANIVLVTARFDMPFAGSVYCTPVADVAIAGVLDTPPADFGGAYRCWNLGPLFNVVEVAPGDIQI